MSEREFDFYLGVLSRLLALRPEQREQIADELRDHLEERLVELTRLGCSREDAIRAALAEFGDAAGLAAHFTQIANIQKRRTVMRMSIGAAGAAAAVLLITTAFWPAERQVPGPQTAVAQQPDPKQSPTGTPGGRNASSEGSLDLVEAKLATRLPKLEIDGTFEEALQFISEKISVDILIDQQFFSDNGLPIDVNVKLRIQHTAVTAKTALELLLEQVGGASLGYTIRDGVVYISEKYQSAEIQVYNCRDLLPVESPKDVAAGGSPPAPGGVPGPAGLGGGGMGGLGGGFGGGLGGIGELKPTHELVTVITSTIHPETWYENGGQGSVEVFNGLLIVKHSQTVQREIKQLLTMMRSAAAEQTVRGSASR